MSIWTVTGTSEQRQVVAEAIAVCDFPFDALRPSLAKEGRTAIRVDWEDLSRFTAAPEAGVHTVERVVDGRRAVLGLFYLPPYTRVVLDTSLAQRPALAREVFLAEAAHAVDYHFMLDRGLRREVWNALHGGDRDLPEGAEVAESGDINHGHSWFDGAGGYSTWTGESWMALFVMTWAPSIPVTIRLDHPITPAMVLEVRAAFDAALAPPDPPPPPPGGGAPGSGGGSAAVFRSSAKGTRVVHDSHAGLQAVEWYSSLDEAQEAGLRPCRVCKP